MVPPVPGGLETEVKKKLGVEWKIEQRETDVLFMKMSRPGAPGLIPDAAPAPNLRKQVLDPVTQETRTIVSPAQTNGRVYHETIGNLQRCTTRTGYSGN